MRCKGSCFCYTEEGGNSAPVYTRQLSFALGNCCYWFEKAKEEGIQLDFQILHCLLGQLLREKKNNLCFAWKLNCYIEETIAIITLGSACRVREVGKKRGCGSKLCARQDEELLPDAQDHQQLCEFVLALKWLKKHGDLSNPYGFPTRSRDTTIRA